MSLYAFLIISGKWHLTIPILGNWWRNMITRRTFTVAEKKSKRKRKLRVIEQEDG